MGGLEPTPLAAQPGIDAQERAGLGGASVVSLHIGQEGWAGSGLLPRERRAKKISLPAQSKALIVGLVRPTSRANHVGQRYVMMFTSPRSPPLTLPTLAKLLKRGTAVWLTWVPARHGRRADAAPPPPILATPPPPVRIFRRAATPPPANLSAARPAAPYLTVLTD